jgi:hypothetical protein
MITAFRKHWKKYLLISIIIDSATCGLHQWKYPHRADWVNVQKLSLRPKIMAPDAAARQAAPYLRSLPQDFISEQKTPSNVVGSADDYDRDVGTT